MEKSNNIVAKIKIDEQALVEISEKIVKNKPFAIYLDNKIVSFLPVKNIKGKNVAFFVVYSDSLEIKNLVLSNWILSVTIIFILLITFYLLRKDYFYNQFISTMNHKLKLKVKKEIDKNTKQELHNYNILFNSMPNAAWVFDPEDGKIVDVNDFALKTYKYRKNELLGMSIYDFNPLVSEYINFETIDLS